MEKCERGRLSLRLLCISILTVVASAHTLSNERIVFQTKHGDIHMAMYPEVAPESAAHILKLAQLGAYNTVNFFRVDRGFVAQVTDIRGNRLVPLNKEQEAEADKNVPLEVRPDAKHSRRGLLSMARWDDPNSGAASFSITLGPAAHLDMHYTVFGHDQLLAGSREVTAGWATLDEFEKQPTKTEGIFVMPKEPIIIQSSYVYTPGGDSTCAEKLASLDLRFTSLSKEMERIRSSKLPNRK